MMIPALVAMALAASAAPTAAFPPSLQGPAMEAWVKANTTIKIPTIIAVGGGRVVAVVSSSLDPAQAGLIRLVIRAELIDPAVAAQAQILSETNVIEVDCAARQIKVGQIQQYAQRNLTGEMRTLPGWTTWAAAAPGTTMDRMVSAACSAGPRRSVAAPLRRGPAAVASVQPAPLVQPAPAARRASSSQPFISQAQLLASTSRAESQAYLEQARTRFGAQIGDRPGSVEAVEVGGQTYYRALISGFSGAADAAAFCSQIKAAGAACFVRQR